MTKKNKFAVVGCGKRIAGLVKILLNKYENIEFSGGYDVDVEQVKWFKKQIGISTGEVYDSYHDLLKDRDVSWVLVGSPNHMHEEHVLEAFKHDKHVFSEKPLAITVKGCREIVRAHQESGKLFATGFVLRYSPLYTKTKELIDGGTIGKIVSVDANENITPAHGSHIMTNWRRFSEYSGGHIVEKCCHDLDLLNWIIDSIPSSIAAFGGNRMFINENKELFKLKDKKAFQGWYNSEDPFQTDKTIQDHLVSILEYMNGVTVQFQATLSNAIPERRFYFSGTEGNLVAELYSSTIKYKRVDDDELKVINFSGSDGHAGADPVIVDALADSMINNTVPTCSGREGMLGSVTGILINQASMERKIIDATSVWRDLKVL